VNLRHQMQKYINLSMRCIFLYLFVCYLATLILLIEYAQRKGNQIIPKTLTYRYIYLIIFPLYRFWALHLKSHNLFWAN
jgi:glycopeptide antibiotics resistance protein